MVEDFLDAARIEAGQLTLSPEPCDVHKIAREVVDLFAGSSPRHRLELVGEPSPVVADPNRLAQVITNLVSNAIKYSPSGGRVRVAVAPSRVRERVEISVSDDGIGIADDKRARLFEPFSRVHSSDVDVPGAGLGLSIVKRLLDAHRGGIEVASEPGRGTTFTAWLPPAPAAA